MGNWIQGVHHIAVKPTPQQREKTIDFYTRILGMEVVKTFGNPERPILMVSCGDGTCIEILGREEAVPADGAFPHVALYTDKIEELAARLEAEGYPMRDAPKSMELAGKACKNAFFFGPTGEEIELFWEEAWNQ